MFLPNPDDFIVAHHRNASLGCGSLTHAGTQGRTSSSHPFGKTPELLFSVGNLNLSFTSGESALLSNQKSNLCVTYFLFLRFLQSARWLPVAPTRNKNLAAEQTTFLKLSASDNFAARWNRRRCWIRPTSVTPQVLCAASIARSPARAWAFMK